MADLLIDTSVLIDAERGGSALGALPAGGARAISVITVSELIHGVHRATSDAVRVRRQVVVEAILEAFQPLPISVQTARVHAQVWAHLEARGELVAAHDLWIAATALAHGLTVATANPSDFTRVPGLAVLPVSIDG